jgi:phenylacetate-coenzyme A ligase PaaK-like adenylate-forming protein
MFGSYVTSRVLYPLHECAMRRPTFRHLRRLLESRALNGDAIVALQAAKLRRVLAQAQGRVPWYRSAMADLGLDALGDDPWQVLAAMPLVARGDLQQHLDRFVAEGAGGLVLSCTSGSSGAPLRFYLDRGRMAADKAARFRAQLQWDIGVGDRKVWLWGRPSSPSLGDCLKSLRDRLMNERVLCAYEMSPETMRRYVDVLRRRRPRSVTCYPSAAWRLCRFALDEGLDLRAAGVRVWFTTGEMLQEHHRRTIEEASGGRVANEYGLREAGFVAHECRRGTMHVTAENVFVETVRRDGTPAGDAIGEIVVTNLDALGMPLVRYRTGDYGRVTRRDCACGWQTQCLDDLSGRQSDFLIAADGTPTVGFALSRRFWDVPGVRQFRVVQESLEQTRVIVVPGDGFDDGSREAIAEIVRDVLGSSVQVEVETSGAIPASPSGKTATFQSRIAAEYL